MNPATHPTWQTESWQIAKPAVTSRGGLVACQHHLAAAAGVELLRAGGNAVDAAAAAAFALGVVEPWMSGIGGVGFMVAAEAKTGKVTVVDFGPVAPAGLDPARYPLAGGAATGSIFGWPAVEGARNDRGYEASTVPGTVDGLGLAVESLGRKSLAEVLAPAIRLAEAGLPLDWQSGLAISLAAADLAKDPVAASIYLPGGLPAMPPSDRPAGALPLGHLARSLKRIAAAGRRDFYEGELAAGIAADLAAGGSPIGAADLAQYHAELREPLGHDYKGVRLHFAGPLSGAPTVIQALDEIGRRLPGLPLGRPDGTSFSIYAEALRGAHEVRLSTLGEGGPSGNTTHLSVVDRDGNMVALTVTLLARFGARIVLPSSGILMNNAINWFDPRPGQPNSLAPGRRPLANMCPMIATRDGVPWIALGACGGRKILSAVTQLASMLIDYDLSLDSAFATPRLDASTGTVLVDAAMDPEWIEQIGAVLPIEAVPDQVYPSHFAVPSAVMRATGTGINSAATHPRSAVAAVLGEEED